MGCGASTPRKSRRVQLELVSSGRLQDKYELHKKVLGRGSFAVVKLCKEIESGAIRACKMVSKYSQERPTQTTQSLNDEIQIFRRMGSHPNILEIFDVYETETIVYIVLELAEGGSLTERIALKGISEADAASVIGQTAAAVQHLHAHAIIHRDIKLDNILLASPRAFVVKLADFGLSKMLAPQQAQRLTSGEGRMMMASAQGSPAFMPPELFELCMVHDGDNPTGEMIYDQTIDVWGLGIVGCMLVTGVHPLRGYSTWQQFLDAMQEGQLTAFDTEPWVAVSEPCKALLRSILHVQPEERATPAQIMSHEWVSGGGASKELLPHVLEGIKSLHLSGLQKIVLQIMEARLHKDQLAETHRLFEQLDADRTGLIRKHELAMVLQQQTAGGSSRGGERSGLNLNLSGDQESSQHSSASSRPSLSPSVAASLDLCFDHLDLKGDGAVSLSEFRAALLAQHAQLMQGLLRPVFEEISHGTGDISADEVVQALQNLGGVTISEAESQALLDEFDLDGRGRLNFAEFAQMMSQDSMGAGRMEQGINEASFRKEAPPTQG